MSIYQHDTHFTLNEANSLIPWLTMKLERMRVLFEIMESRGFNPVNAEWTPRDNGHSGSEPPQEFNEFLEIIAELDMKGVMIENYRLGIIDFPYIRKNGEEVYLCWMRGEPAVTFWHRISDKFFERTPIPIPRDESDNV